ncbi:hypothetical protein N7468_003015 [Penicillium chermesinum]|uniref:DUF221 domain protein n=1 Tax=Penicillium chermesinum TaxID=63820 RepID=A0A9W9P5Q0_9EURO|nr:uncharacterized protein N7468_003015 [Penicillium chermesinum]KAJ5238396.1 hypothetical protein N7468_003015 [Penicillium chermesinum]
MTNIGDALEHAGGHGKADQGESISTFAASLVTAIIVFAVEFLLFMFLKSKLTRIYQPRTYLVPDRERTQPSPPGLFRWIGPVFRTSSTEFIQKCGLDAYFFLRYLRMLLKIFVPLGLLILPVLLSVNRAGGKDQNFQNGTGPGPQWNVTGLDQLAWGNVKPENTNRYWAHLAMAVIAVVYVCAVFFDELRGYIRLRQTYLTSPQHRLRASATTVLVTAIPPEWLSVDRLDNLFNVFPGGIRNIWLNRNYDELNEKVKARNKLALKLESAETDLIIKCKKAQLKKLKAEGKKNKQANKLSLEDKEKMATDRRAAQMAMEPGVSSGDPHEAHTVQETLHPEQGVDTRARRTSDASHNKVFDPALAAAGAVGLGVEKLGRSVLGTLKKADGGFDSKMRNTRGFDASAGNGFPPLSTKSSPTDAPVAASPASPSMSRTTETTPVEGTLCRESDAEPQPKRPFWKSRKSSGAKNAPEADEHPLTAPETPAVDDAARRGSAKSESEKENGKSENRAKEDSDHYPIAYNQDFSDENYGEPVWQRFIKRKDRDTMRLPIFKWSWWPSIWLIGKKVDTIDYCRQELARLNMEIEIDQQHSERFPLMNSAFIQFNHQVAAHMACQSVSHHLPKQMAPRVVEISPDDVIWDNMSIKWWERYVRTAGIFIVVAAMVVAWAFPVAFTGLLSQISYLEGAFSWLRWLEKLPSWFIAAVQGILPALFLAILMAVLPLSLRFLSKTQGVHTGMAIELAVQNYYFAFLFVQLFLVVTVASSFSTIIDHVTDITSWPQLLATNIPKSSNYFFSYMILQAMSVSAGALTQIFSLISWFILAPIFDNTARKKWARATNLNQVQWGTFFPVYTTLACIGMIYCVIAPLILVFNVITFGLFWFVYRYNTLYVTKFRFDTGGLLFPCAINQLFTGLYVMELSLIGLFFLVQDQHGDVACKGQAIVMIVVMVLTVGYQILLNNAFGPLIRYLPITLEDDACRRDEEFRRAQHARLGLAVDEEDDENDPPADHAEGHPDQEIELRIMDSEKQNGSCDFLHTPRRSNPSYLGPNIESLRKKMAQDTESQAPPSKVHALFAGIHDELEDLTPDERDQLVQRAFQHEALRAKQPVIWIPRDDIGVSNDEVYRTQRYSKHIWVSNEYQALDGKCRTIFSRSPPDFSEVDLIQL